MDVSNIVSVAITVSTATPTAPNFGVPLIAVSKVPSTWGSLLVQTFSQPSDLVTAGFAVTDPAYLAATAICSQNPRPPQFKVAKRSHPAVQSLQLQVLDATVGDVFSFTLVNGATKTPISYTVPSGSPTTTTVASAIEALIAAVSGVTASSSTSTITFGPSTVGVLLDIQNWSPNFHFYDATPDPGIVADLTAINTEDSGWYGLILDSSSALQVEAATPWVESNTKLFCWDTSDTDVKDPTKTTDVGSVTQTATYTRSPGWFRKAQLLAYFGAGIMSNRFVAAPGSDTWAFKTVAGAVSDSLNTTESNALAAKNVNFYVTISGLPDTLWGTCPSGQYIDVIRFIDWLCAQIQLRVYQAIKNSPKLPFSDKGIDVIRAIIMGCLRDGVDAGGLLDNSNLFVNVPLAANVDSVSKGERLVPGITFGGELASAIHKMSVSGTITL